MTAAGFSWTSNSGLTSLTMNTLQGDLTLTGSPFDRIAVSGTPNSASRVFIRNFSTSTTPSEVYVSRKSVMPLDVSGNFDLYVGRKLNADGSVSVSQVLDVFEYDNAALKYQPTGDILPLTKTVLWQNFQFVNRYDPLLAPFVYDGHNLYEFYNYLSTSSNQIPCLCFTTTRAPGRANSSSTPPARRY